MSSLQEIEEAIETLSPREQAKLYEWMDSRYEQEIEAKLARQLEAGVFDEHISQALAEEAAGDMRAL